MIVFDYFCINKKISYPYSFPGTLREQWREEGCPKESGLDEEL